MGYNYDLLYRYAEEMVQYLQRRGRVVDLAIEIPNRREEEDEYYMVYDHERLTRDSLRVQDIHSALSNLLFTSNLGKQSTKGRRTEIVLTPNTTGQPDTGGFAAMILLCGLTVNAGIYLINEYNRIREEKKCRNAQKMFLKTWNHKIIPILLTVLSTICGLIPFLLDGPSERFWFSLAVGSISGLTFSLLTLVLLMPLMIRKK